jgi:lipopolysaccharide transport system ATP-binding protein
MKLDQTNQNQNPIIVVRNLAKSYKISHERGKYVALRDVLTWIFKNPFRFLFHKTKNVVGLGKKETFWALKDVNFEINKGEAVGVIGHNGAGKSTLLKILTGITPPTEGEVVMHGKVASLLEVGTGFHPELTGKENIFLNGAILGMGKKEIERKLEDIIEFAGVRKFIDTPVKHYSSGMYVRLAFAVAAHLEPDILLVDEVLAVGDAEFQKKCLGKMDEVTKDAGRTILLVSHNMGAIQRLCKRTILIEGGKVKMFGPTAEVIDHYLNQSQTFNKTALRDRTDRSGNGDLRITNCYIKSPDGFETTQTVSGEDTKIVFEYSCKPGITLRNVVIGANVTNQQGESLFICHNQMTDTDFGEISGNGSFECVIKHNPLVPGLYFLNFRMTAEDVVIDSVNNITHIEVLLGDFFKTGSTLTHSKFLVDQTWSQKNNEQ